MVEHSTVCQTSASINYFNVLILYYRDILEGGGGCPMLLVCWTLKQFNFLFVANILLFLNNRDVGGILGIVFKILAMITKE